MRLARKQLEFLFVPQALRLPNVAATSLREVSGISERRGYSRRGRDYTLELQSRELLRALGADKLAREIRVEWNPRMRSAAGRADYCNKLVSLNPLLKDHADEIDRTLRHELAHLLAQWRIGRRRVAPHGIEWRQACVDLGIADEARCHNLPFASKTFLPRFMYVCPNCKEKFPRVRRIRGAIACLACCRAHNRGEFDPRFRLRLIRSQQKERRKQRRSKD
jgi:SprT protein